MKRNYAAGLLVIAGAFCLSMGFMSLRAQVPGQTPVGIFSVSSTPVTLPSPTAWYSADCITFISSVCGVPADGATITTWADRSGNGNTATVGGGTCTFHTNQINGKPAVTFASCFLTLGTPIPAGNSQNIFAVAKLTNAAGCTCGIFSGSTSSFEYGTYQVPQQIFAKTNVLFIAAGSTNLGTSGWNQMNAAHVNNGDFTLRVNRTVDASGTGPGNPNGTITAAQTTIGQGGGADFWVGQIAEIEYYCANGTGACSGGAQLTTPQVLLQENIFNAKYGL